MAEWYEKIFDNDYIRAYAKQNKDTAEDVDGIIELLSPGKNMKILDLCSGYGRHSLELARRGYNTTGYDLSEEFLKYAKKKASEEKLKVNFVHGDVRELEYKDEYDIVLNLYTSFGFFSHDENQEVIESIARALVPNGRFLIQALCFSGLIRRANPEQPATVYEGDGVTIVDTRDWDLEQNMLNVNRKIFFNDGGRNEYSFTLRIYTLAEMLRMIEKAGLKLVDYFGNLKGNTFDYQSAHYVIIAEKTF
jgi:2-polyprenyl-3-methyl-5-hydroxy-6-metoxy-1,4-benzoquinol methylase